MKLSLLTLSPLKFSNTFKKVKKILSVASSNQIIRILALVYKKVLVKQIETETGINTIFCEISANGVFVSDKIRHYL